MHLCALCFSTPLKIKEQHFRPVTTTSLPCSISSGTDGEDSYAEDVMNNNNNNNNYATNLASSTKRMPKLYFKDDINHVQNVAIPQTVRSKLNAPPTKRFIPSIDELKKQLVNSDIDISEIKIGSVRGGPMVQVQEEEDEEVLENGEMEEDDEGMDFKDEYGQMGYNESNCEDQDNEDNSEDAEEEGASTSNQSFYDYDLGEHFLFKTEGDSESNYEDDGIMTPNFGMVDELYRRASMAANASGSSEVPTSVRRRTFHNPCKLCKKVFPSLSMLKKHAKTHLNEDGGSQHICKFCFDYFASPAALSKHLSSHLEENPNVCKLCSKSFTSWVSLILISKKFRCLLI